MAAALVTAAIAAAALAHDVIAAVAIAALAIDLVADAAVVLIPGKEKRCMHELM